MTSGKHKCCPSAFLRTRKHSYIDESSADCLSRKNGAQPVRLGIRLTAPVIFGSVLYLAQHIGFGNRVENATV
jgi:hypothetical protein